jgi:hypothetical protein
MTYYTVSTNGTGLVTRIVEDTDTTVYNDSIIAVFDTWEEAKKFEEENDHLYWDDNY